MSAPDSPAPAVDLHRVVSLVARWRDTAAQHRKFAKEYELAREPDFLVSAHTSTAQVFEQCAGSLSECASSTGRIIQDFITQKTSTQKRTPGSMHPAGSATLDKEGLPVRAEDWLLEDWHDSTNIMTKPTTKKIEALDWHECTKFIEEKYKIETRDYARSHRQFGEWVKASGEPETTCRQGCSPAEIKAHQEQYARFNAAIASGQIVERPYQDFWHFICDKLNPSREGFIEMDDWLGEDAEPWQKEILALYLKEFDAATYHIDW